MGPSTSTLLPRRSLVDSTIKAIREQVIHRLWRVGTRIPPEAELAERFGVGRNTVREAIRVLSHSQMLEVRQGDGTYVRSQVDPAETVRVLGRVGLLDHLELQRLLETEAARFAARRATAADIASLRALLELRGDHVHGPEKTEAQLNEFLDRDGDFHKGIALASHNEGVQALCVHFLGAVRTHTRRIVEDGGLPEPDLAAHRAIVDAIESRDEVGAALAAHHMLTPLIERLRPVDPPSR